MATALTWGLAEILQEKHISQRELSRQTAITREAIGRMVHGKTIRAELPIIAKLVEALRVPLSAILVSTPAPAQRVTPTPPISTPAPTRTPAPQPPRHTGRQVHFAITGEKWPATTAEEQAEDLALRQARTTVAASPPLPPTESVDTAVDNDNDEDDEEMAALQALLDKLDDDPAALLSAQERALYKKYDLRYV